MTMCVVHMEHVLTTTYVFVRRTIQETIVTFQSVMEFWQMTQLFALEMENVLVQTTVLV